MLDIMLVQLNDGYPLHTGIVSCNRKLEHEADTNPLQHRLIHGLTFSQS